MAPDVVVDLLTTETRDRRSLPALLCSDGLNGMLSDDEEILAICREQRRAS